jgi:hypothetical protein
MLVLGLLLLAAGIVAIVAAIFGASGTASYVGVDVGGATLFFLGVAATLAVLGGTALTRWGTGRALRHRHEHRRLRELEREHRSAEAPTAKEAESPSAEDHGPPDRPPTD